MFRTSYVHLQGGYIVHAALFGMFTMHLWKQSSRRSFSLLDCLHKHTIFGCMYNIVFVKMTIRCSKHVEDKNWIKVLILKCVHFVGQHYVIIYGTNNVELLQVYCWTFWVLTLAFYSVIILYRRRQWGEVFGADSNRPQGSPRLLYNGHRAFLGGVKRP
jgi:hypothetical protein